jgi:hypothetical protein
MIDQGALVCEGRVAARVCTLPRPHLGVGFLVALQTMGRAEVSPAVSTAVGEVVSVRLDVLLEIRVLHEAGPTHAAQELPTLRLARHLRRVDRFPSGHLLRHLFTLQALRCELWHVDAVGRILVSRADCLERGRREARPHLSLRHKLSSSGCCCRDPRC